MSKRDACKENSVFYISVLGGSGWQGGAVKDEIPAKRHQTPFHLYTNARCSTPTPVFSDVALELLVISIPPIQLIEMRRPLIDLFNCLSCLTDFGYSVKCDTFVL